MAVRDFEESGINLKAITQRLMANDNLMKLLYYTDKDPLDNPPLTEEQKRKEVFNKILTVIPRIGPREDARSFVALSIDKGQTITTNTEFRAIKIEIEVFVPSTQWLIKDDNLRPFAIMNQIEKSLNNKVINGLGKIQGGDFDRNFISEEMTSYIQVFWITEYV